MVQYVELLEDHLPSIIVNMPSHDWHDILEMLYERMLMGISILDRDYRIQGYSFT